MKQCLLLVLLLAPLGAVAETAILYRDVTLFDGTGTRYTPHRSILVEDERIAAVGGPDLKVPDGTKIVDGSGKFVIPGLIDSHVHLATQPKRGEAEMLLKRNLLGGVTLVRDMAGDARFLAELSRQTQLGEVAGPDIAYSALMAGPEFFVDPRTHAASQGLTAGAVPWLQAVDGKTEIRLAVARAIGTGESGIKIYADLPAAIVRKIVAEAHRQHIPVWAHAMVFPATPAEGIDAGIDVISHSCLLAYQAMPVRPLFYHNRAAVEAGLIDRDRDATLAKLFQAMKKRSIALDATLRVYREADKRPGTYCPSELADAITAQAHRAGVTVIAGTDGQAPADAAWPELFDEIGLLVEKAGFTPAEALLSATSQAANAIGRGKDFGTVEAGKLADFVVLREDPTKDPAALKSVELVVKRGAEFRRNP
jgi:imidazolonepropionase-like amidohydrolase